jgi:hypothetical protein
VENKNKNGFGGFQLPQVRRNFFKLQDFYTWFSMSSQNIKG